MKIKKTGGEYPCQTVVLDETIEFDQNGYADVSDEIGKILLQIPGYQEMKEQETQVPSQDEINEKQPEEKKQKEKK